MDLAPLDRLRNAVDRVGRATSGRARTGRMHDDADGEVGSIATDSAIGFDPFPLLGALSGSGAHVITGIIERADVASSNDVIVRYVAARNLIAMRAAACRLKDLRRNAEMERLCRSN